ncbi:MAG: diguanylate cyclase [Deltaproteobacteria bacterium]|nr:diguanylate cyclase [Deltaproteobacteria bacterium]
MIRTREQTGQIQITGSSFKPALTRSRKKTRPQGCELGPATTTLLESMPFGVHVYRMRRDGHLEIVWANSRADRILGTDNAKYIGLTLDETFPQLSDTEVPGKYLRTAASGDPWHADQVFMSGSRIDGAFEVFAFQVEKGVVAVAFRDITHRKESQFKDAELRRKLEQQVAVRTRELQKANKQLKEVLAERGNAEMAVRHRLAMERLVTQLAIRFINVSSDDMDYSISSALAEIGEFARADRVYIARIIEGTDRAFILHQWTVPGDTPFQGDMMNIDFGVLPTWRNMVKHGDVIHIPDVSKMKARQSLEQRILTSRATQSMLAVPLQFGGATLGFLGLESTRRRVDWTREDSTIMTAIGTVLVNAMERAKAEVLLHEKAIQDPLTGLFNHRYILEQLAQALQSAHEKGRILTVALCDFDDFKGINDRHGHRTGDEVLIEFSKILNRELRATDMAGRCGGDEFLLLFPDTADVQARGIMERIHGALKEKEFEDAAKQRFTTSFSFGLACSRPDTRVPEELFSAADEALYGAKNTLKQSTDS